MPTTWEAIKILATNLYDNADIIPGSAIIKDYIKRSYQNDPFRVALEALLLFFAIRYMTTKKYQLNSNYVKLTQKVLNIEDSNVTYLRFCVVLLLLLVLSSRKLTNLLTNGHLSHLFPIALRSNWNHSRTFVQSRSNRMRWILSACIYLVYFIFLLPAL